MRKHYLFMGSVILFILICIYTINQYTVLNLPPGSEIPLISFRDLQNNETMVSCGDQTTIIMIFREKCLFCRYQLNILRQNSGLWNQCKLYLLSLDPLEFEGNNAELWKDMTKYHNAVLGSVNKASVMRYFGAVTIPAVFFYNEQCRLFESRNGIIEWGEWKNILNQINTVEKIPH